MMIAGDLEQRNEKWFLSNRSHTCGRTIPSIKSPFDRRQIAPRAYLSHIAYCKSSRGYLPDCHLPISPSPHNSSILLPRRILLRTGTKDVARSFLSFLETGLSTLDIEPLHCTVFPASSSNFDHNVYVYVLYIQADITDKTRHRKPSRIYTYIYICIFIYTVIYTWADRIVRSPPKATPTISTDSWTTREMRARVHELAVGENSARGQRRDITRTDDRRAETWRAGYAPLVPLLFSP